MKSNIALVGFMAVGKSAVGQLLAQKIGKTFVEVDSMIEKHAGKSINRIFKEESEIAFREYEIAVIKEICSRKNLVLACGGGVVLNKINIDRLRQESVIIWLTASFQSILQRLKDSKGNRPLITGKNSETEVQSLLSSRQPFYKMAADVRVNTTGLTVEQVVDKILIKLKSYADYY
jgi:shikimate kinase